MPIDRRGRRQSACWWFPRPGSHCCTTPAGRARAARDNNRIVEAAQAAGLKQIDYLLISHYDVDHLGDVPALMAAFPVKHIIDNGSLQTPGGGL